MLRKGGFSMAGKRMLKMVAYKTASVSFACGEMAALPAGAIVRNVPALRQYGHSLPRALMLRDGALDLATSVGGLGKPLSSDMPRGKML